MDYFDAPNTGNQKPAMSFTTNKKLSDEQLLDVIKLLEDADQNHRDWLRALHVSMICNQPFEPDVFREDAHRRCLFGQWYYDEVPDLLQAQDEFAALEPLHKSMHDAARSLTSRYCDNDPVVVEEYENFVDKQSAFSAALLGLRDKLRKGLYSFDSLTGLMTREPFALILESEYARLERTSGNSCIVLMDIDYFKRVNDVHGHLMGDRVLREVAQYIRSHLRPYDSVCRYGGEEFLLILPNTTLEKAHEIIDRLRQEIAQLEICCDQKGKINVTVSAGIAPISDNARRSSVGEADRALYEAKSSGRNKVCMTQENFTRC